MVLFGLTVIVVDSTNSTTANSVLILSFLVPAVAFSAVAGVYVDRFDKRLVLVGTNVLRALLSIALWAAGANLLLLVLFNALISTVTVFFAPAEAAMIPQVVPRRQLLSANGVFTLTLNAAFAIGFALLGPLVVTLLGAPALILVVGVVLPGRRGLLLDPARRRPRPVAVEGEPQHGTAEEAEEAMGSTLGQLREGIAFIRANRRIAWSLVYLGIAASLVGVLGVLGPGFAKDSLGLETKDFVVVVLPLAFGIVMGILFLNNFGHLMPRRRIIEYGLIALGILVFLMAAAGPISRFLEQAEAVDRPLRSSILTLPAVVVFFALLAGIAYAFVAIPAQTQLQEDLPEDVRGRVFGVLNMLVSDGELPADHHRRPGRGHLRDDRGPVRRRDRHHRVGHPVLRDPGSAQARGGQGEGHRARHARRLRSRRGGDRLRDGGRRTAPLAPRRARRRQAGAPRVQPRQRVRARTSRPMSRASPTPSRRRTWSRPPPVGVTRRGRVAVRGAGTLITGRIATLAGRDGPGWVEAIAIAGRPRRRGRQARRGRGGAGAGSTAPRVSLPTRSRSRGSPTHTSTSRRPPWLAAG